MKILIFNPFGIGDVLFTTPLIRNIKEHLPSSYIGYISNRRTFPLLEDNIFLDKVFIFEKDEWRKDLRRSKVSFLKRAVSFWRNIKKEKYDVVFDLSLNPYYRLFLKTLYIKKRIGFSFKNRRHFLTHKINILYYKDKHVAHYYLELAKFLNIPTRDYKFDIFFKKEDWEKAEVFLEKYNIKRDDLLIGLVPGSGDSWNERAYYKRWPEQYFAYLVNLLIKELEAKVVLFGSSKEISVVDKVYNLSNFKPVNLAGKLTLKEFCSVLSFCDLVVTNDGGPLHIAQALGKKVVVLFGPVDENVYGLYPNETLGIVIKKDIPCRPCYKMFKFRGCLYDKKCLRDIRVKEVFDAVKQILSRDKEK